MVWETWYQLVCIVFFTCKQKDFITGDQIHLTGHIWNLLCIHYSCLQLMCLGTFLLKVISFVPQLWNDIFVTGLELELPSRTLETFNMLWITTLGTSISSFVCLVWIKLLKGWSDSLIYACWKVVSACSCLVGIQFLDASCNYFDVSSGLSVKTPFSLASCLTLHAGNLSRSILELFYGLGENSSSFRQTKQNISLCKILAVSGGYLARDIWAWTVFIPFINRSVSLSEACHWVNLALTSFVCGLQNLHTWPK